MTRLPTCQSLFTKWFTTCRLDGERPARVPNNVIANIRGREVRGAVELPKSSGLAPGDHVKILGGCGANAVVTRDPAGGRKFDKAKSSGQIDALVALAMALLQALPRNGDRRPHRMMFISLSRRG